jgi:hypothetical protein
VEGWRGGWRDGGMEERKDGWMGAGMAEWMDA